ncbi:MAG: UDP-N-acetylglucosamine 4,6-dehydratase (EC [uncultured Sulfurovum sp.]|uniref:UDP-N-acetylglucosamine 4,6-dehydratase (EC) n=1 Tax=uncultured Sulfurovum sp. TaxID=269237 RepID=A0A6S6T1T6_9BACT|nr:MAG: UDP-N-acetylglucosamine 4,6-dehydratase (EC [uncultured Sulfurovum sp.]
MSIDKRFLNIAVIVLLTILTFSWTFWIFHREILWDVIIVVSIVRIVASLVIYKDYSLSWSKASQKTFLLKSAVYIAAFAIYMPIFYSQIHIYFFISELFAYLFGINFLMYSYYSYVNRGSIKKTKTVVIYGAGKAGLKLGEEFTTTEYKVKYFVDDARSLQKRSVDTINIISKDILRKRLNNKKMDLLVIAMPSVDSKRTKEIYTELHNCFKQIKILPSLHDILSDRSFVTQLKSISLVDLLARNSKDLDNEKIETFIKHKAILVTGAGGSIGSEIVRQCVKYGAKKLILLDHSEYNLYAVEQAIGKANVEIVPVMQSVVNKLQLEKTFKRHRPQIVIHAAAYKHVPMVEVNIEEAILNNVVGTKNCIDIAVAHGVEKFVLISTDKAVRPTNVMGATKRICELYAQNSNGQSTDIVAVRFGNVLGSSGSVIPKFKSQIENGQNVTVTHPEVSRYFMLVHEACELVLQAGAIGKGGEIFILDMGEPIKIVDLAKKMIKLSEKEDVKIEITGLRPGEKLYEELLIDESDMHTEYESITVAAPTQYSLEYLNKDIENLLKSQVKLVSLKKIVPEFNHNLNT